MAELPKRDFRFFALRPLGLFIDFDIVVPYGFVVLLFFVDLPFSIEIDALGRWSNRLEMWLYALAPLFVYGIIMESWRGQTVGKLAFGMKIVDSNGGKPSLFKIVSRNVIKAIELTVLPLALLSYFITRRSFGERLTGTRIITRSNVIQSTPVDRSELGQFQQRS